MMSSVIPARLLFQCGHAALVSLPRVKGESPAQRNDRIAREKSAAQARSCDFCPPMGLAEIAEAVVVAAAPVAPVAPVAAVALDALDAPVALDVDVVDVVEVVEELVAPPSVAVAPVAPAAHDPSAAPATLEVAVTTDTSARRLVPRAPRNGSAVRAVAHNAGAPGFRFVVRFRTEAVVQAKDMRDALRQAESLGAADVLSVVAIG